MDCPACGASRPDVTEAHFCPACGGELGGNVPDPLLDKTVGGRFHIVSLIAEGGMGRVYAAEQRMGNTLRRVAIKTLLPEVAQSEAQVQRFLLECSMVAELEHPNTIKFYDWGQTDHGGLFIAMEFVSGESLGQLVRTEGIVAAERLDVIVGQICGSLQEAHDKGIIHRDVKPENILLTNPAGEADFVKVLDFGIAKRSEAGAPKLTPLGLVLGSPAYMSPEQFSHGAIDHRSDIYSLAVVAFEALTGQAPFNAHELGEWPLLHRHAEPLPFDATGVAVPEGMKRAISRALAKRPADRQASMAEFYGEFTMGTPRRSSLGGRGLAPDQAETLVRLSGSPRTSTTPFGVGVERAPASPAPPTRSAPPVEGDTGSHGGSSAPPGESFGGESSAAPPPLVVPPPPRLPASWAPAGSPAPSQPPLTHSLVPNDASISMSPPSRLPTTEREPVPPTVRERTPARWPLLLLGIVIALAIGGALAVLVLPSRVTDDRAQPTAEPLRPKPKATVAPEQAH